MNSRFCNYCKVEHELSSAHWYRLESSPRCKAQVKFRKKLSYDPIKTGEKNRKYREVNRVKLNADHRVWREKNLEKHRKNAREYYWNNRERVMKRHVAYCRKRQSVDLEFKLACRIRSRMYLALRYNRQVKTGSAVQDLGCSLDQFRKHITEQFAPGMTWENYGSIWELDHILPLANYQLSDRGTFRRLVHYTNYQPLLVSDNRRKLNHEV